MTGYTLPSRVEVGGHEYRINTDYRDILDIIERLQNPDKPEFIRWYEALALFYEEFDKISAPERGEAMERLCWFLRGGQGESDTPADTPLLDWRHDCMAIVADVNRVAGCEIRALEYLHWWTFLSWFNAVGEGQLSMLVGIRQKLRKGKKLEKWEQEYYRANRARVDLKRQYSAEEQAERERLKRVLGE